MGLFLGYLSSSIDLYVFVPVPYWQKNQFQNFHCIFWYLPRARLLWIVCGPLFEHGLMKINILCCFFSHIILGNKMVMVLRPIHSSAITPNWFHHYWERVTSSQGRLHILRHSVYKQISPHRKSKERERQRKFSGWTGIFFRHLSHFLSLLNQTKMHTMCPIGQHFCAESSLNNKNNIKSRWKVTVSVLLFFV